VQTETGWAFVDNNKCKGNICKDNVIRHLKGAIVASGGASLSDQSITGNVDNGTKITSPNETLTGWTPDGEIDTPTSSTPEEPATVTAGRIGVNDQCVLAWDPRGQGGAEQAVPRQHRWLDPDNRYERRGTCMTSPDSHGLDSRELGCS
jgi:hypothetical protein